MRVSVFYWKIAWGVVLTGATVLWLVGRLREGRPDDATWLTTIVLVIGITMYWTSTSAERRLDRLEEEVRRKENNL